VGEGTDIVGKETYTFEDRGGRSLTLRPEGTAGVSRAFVTHGMHREPAPVKLWYSASMFRYEKPQAGRLREHEQLGCEAMGSELPAVDAEVIAVQAGIYRDLALPDLTLNLNSVGSGEARAAYREALLAYLEPHASELDRDSRERLALNPLRILDSKDPRTREIVAGAPTLPDFLTEGDREHFTSLRRMLDAAGIDHIVDPMLVRGLDYYTRTVWEFTSSALGAQSTVGAGGRYDGLVELLGGPATPAVGFGTGIERIVLCLEAMGQVEEGTGLDAFLVVDPADGEEALVAAFGAVQRMRTAGLRVEIDLLGRSLNAQGKRAAKLAPLWRATLGLNGSVLTARDVAVRDTETAETFADALRAAGVEA